MSKIYQSYETLLLFLQNEKNLKIEDMEAARHILKKTSYFSLITGYKDIFKNPTTGKYIDGTSFEHIYRLYQFDHELRNVFLKYILIAERSVKSSLAYHFTSAYGENQLQYLSKDNYMLSSSNQKAIQKLINIFSFQLERNREYAYMNHYRNKYHNVPLWIMVQVLTVGQIAHMFDYLKSTVTIKICIDHHNIGIRDMHSFLYRVLDGKADKSYGINVARLAHLPSSVLERAKQILDNLELQPNMVKEVKPPLVIEKENPQHMQIINQVKQVDVNKMTPMEAMQFLYELKEKMS